MRQQHLLHSVIFMILGLSHAFPNILETPLYAILTSCDHTDLCCLDVFPKWYASVMSKTITRKGKIVKNVYNSGLRSPIESVDAVPFQIPYQARFRCKDMVTNRSSSYASRRIKGPWLMRCPALTHRVKIDFVSSLDPVAPTRTVAYCKERPALRKKTIEVKSGTSECIDTMPVHAPMINIPVPEIGTTTDADLVAWINTIQTPNIGRIEPAMTNAGLTDQLSWSDLTSGNLISKVTHRSSLEVFPKHANGHIYRACYHRAAGFNSVIFNVATSF